MKLLKKWQSLNLFTRIMIGFVLGIVAGIILGEHATKLAFLGTILTRLLTMVVAPLVLGLLICAAADVKDIKTLGKIGGKTLGIFLGGTAVAVAIGLILSNVMQIGAGFVMDTDVSYDATEIPSIADTLMNIIPTNPFNALSEQNLLQIIFFALLLGFALIGLGEKGAPVLDFFRSWTEAWKAITNIVLEFTPYGVFGLMANIVGQYGLDVMLPFLKTIAACYLTCFLFTVFVQGGLMVGLYGGINPIKFFSVMKEAILFVFATCSSVATIPLNLKCTKNLGVSDKVADFVIPFGAVMNMNGTAIYEAVAVIFASQVFGVHLTVSQQIMVMVTAVLASIGTAGIPGSGLVMLTIVLNAVNLPLETIGLLAGIDRILNMARVVPNIVGDAAAAVVVAKSEGELRPELAGTLSEE
jgi:Na+/H+-dicarboxylate symporter